MTSDYYWKFCIFLLAISLSRWRRECKQSQKSTDTQGFKRIETEPQTGGGVGSVWEGGSKHTKPNRLHALAIRAAVVAAAVPEQSPPASRLWGATPESPYWSLEWAETHFLWAQVTWRKEQNRVEARGHSDEKKEDKREVGCRWGNVLGRGEGKGGGGTRRWGIE